jgi:hypothetical protein
VQPIVTTAAFDIGDGHPKVIFAKEPRERAIGFLPPALNACDIKRCPACVDGCCGF